MIELIIKREERQTPFFGQEEMLFIDNSWKLHNNFNPNPNSNIENKKLNYFTTSQILKESKRISGSIKK